MIELEVERERERNGKTERNIQRHIEKWKGEESSKKIKR